MNPLPKIILGNSRHPACIRPGWCAENTLVFGTTGKRMNYLPKIKTGRNRPIRPFPAITAPPG